MLPLVLRRLLWIRPLRFRSRSAARAYQLEALRELYTMDGIDDCALALLRARSSEAVAWPYRLLARQNMFVRIACWHEVAYSVRVTEVCVRLLYHVKCLFRSVIAHP